MRATLKVMELQSSGFHVRNFHCNGRRQISASKLCLNLQNKNFTFAPRLAASSLSQLYI